MVKPCLWCSVENREVKSFLPPQTLVSVTFAGERWTSTDGLRWMGLQRGEQERDCVCLPGAEKYD